MATVTTDQPIISEFLGGKIVKLIKLDEICIMSTNELSLGPRLFN